jgi:Xaa-Pro aminopeptidase
MFDLAAVQAALREAKLDGWLMYDFRGSNILARRILGFTDDNVGSRRWVYFIPAQGTPRKLVHRIEMGALDAVPGDKEVYLRWQEFEAGLKHALGGAKCVAMEYMPRNGIPTLCRVDAGTVELVRSLGADVVSSGDLIQQFEAVLDDEQWQLHLEADRHTRAAFDVAWSTMANGLRSGKALTERMVQDAIMAHFAAHGLTTYHPPIVGVGPNSGDPHYETGDAPLREGDFVLVDLWAKMDKPRSVYSDLTRVGFLGTSVPAKYEEIFQIVAAARDAAIARVRAAFATGQPLYGYQVDDAARAVIERAGHGAAFVHRTGHSIGQETHGNGTNMDNLETHDARRVLKRTLFSVEPGIYLPEFGVRSEVNVYVDQDGQVHVTGDLQKNVLPVLAAY